MTEDFELMLNFEDDREANMNVDEMRMPTLGELNEGNNECRNLINSK